MLIVDYLTNYFQITYATFMCRYLSFDIRECILKETSWMGGTQQTAFPATCQGNNATNFYDSLRTNQFSLQRKKESRTGFRSVFSCLSRTTFYHDRVIDGQHYCQPMRDFCSAFSR